MTTPASVSSEPAEAVRSSASRPLFRLDQLCIRLGASNAPREILRNVSFDVYEGEFLTIVGRSGTGKTTLLRAMAGLVPFSGGLTYGGEVLAGPRGDVIMVFQDYGNALLPWRTVERNVALGLESLKLPAKERTARVGSALEMVGLGGRAKDFPWRLSGGMQQRVQIARALAMRPKVLLMDEPFGALDAMTKASLQDELLRVQRETGSTIVFITHDMEEAVYLSDRVVSISGTPGTVGAPVTVGLTRPRDQITTREDVRFLRVRHQLGEALHDAT